MKKILLSIVLVMSLCSISYAQIDSVLSNVPDTSKLTLNKVYTDVKEGINGLAQSLKVPAAHVYEVLVKQQVANSITNICLVLFLLISCLLCGRYASITYKAHLVLYKQAGHNSNPDLDDTAKGILSCVLTVISVILGISTVFTFCVYMQETVIGFINPEYGAIKEIISFIK